MAHLLQHTPQGWQPPVSTSISPCLAPVGLQPQGCLTPSSPRSCMPVRSVSHSSSAVAPLVINAGSHAQHRKRKGKQSHALHAYLLDKTARHFCLLSADEWYCLGCEIGLQIPLRAQLLAGSLQLQPPIARGAFWQGLPTHPREKLLHSIPPSASAPMQRWCQIYGALRDREHHSLSLGCVAEQIQTVLFAPDFMVFPTLHSSFVHLPFQHQQTNKGTLRPL